MAERRATSPADLLHRHTQSMSAAGLPAIRSCCNRSSPWLGQKGHSPAQATVIESKRIQATLNTDVFNGKMSNFRRSSRGWHPSWDRGRAITKKAILKSSISWDIRRCQIESEALTQTQSNDVDVQSSPPLPWTMQPEVQRFLPEALTSREPSFECPASCRSRPSCRSRHPRKRQRRPRRFRPTGRSPARPSRPRPAGSEPSPP
jgi:hypothetical protein